MEIARLVPASLSMLIDFCDEGGVLLDSHTLGPNEDTCRGDEQNMNLEWKFLYRPPAEIKEKELGMGSLWDGWDGESVGWEACGMGSGWDGEWVGWEAGGMGSGEGNQEIYRSSYRQSKFRGLDELIHNGNNMEIILRRMFGRRPGFTRKTRRRCCNQRVL
ncbi:hypothetical protein PoB_006425500 [Plakobranchus ocellatus]|uniref:Uncharacterized protein n=1 Tax=Plakobranchus ocellatus TaxID=259542 RepID=A0AAV4D0V0_9GAST|nr:hypothetical protein PoB_006425500 [Plakobranchus ocellatus]